MTDKKPENPQAFPTNDTVQGDQTIFAGQPGMTLLDWYAGKALVGDMSAFTKELDHCYDPDMVAVRCFDYAEAMLAERQKKNGEGMKKPEELFEEWTKTEAYAIDITPANREEAEFAFLWGHASRDAEVEELKVENEALRGQIGVLRSTMPPRIYNVCPECKLNELRML